MTTAEYNNPRSAPLGLCWAGWDMDDESRCEQLEIARLRAELATSNECRLANEAELVRADGIIGELRTKLATANGRIERLRTGILVYRRGCIDAKNKEGSADGVKLADLLLSWDTEPATEAELERSFAEMLYRGGAFDAAKGDG